LSPHGGPPAQAGLRRGTHFIRTNGNEDELWIVFQRSSLATRHGRWRYLERELRTPCRWVGPKFLESSSDARVKTNVRQVEGALDNLERIRGVAFESAEVDSPHALGGVPGTPSIGVVAQEVEEVFPELVSIYDPEQEYRAVDYNGFTGVLIEAVKELKAQNEELRSRIEALEGA
jgi:Chaperone of endosialidase